MDKIILAIITLITFVIFSIGLQANNVDLVDEAQANTKKLQDGYAKIVFYKGATQAEEMLKQAMEPLKDVNWYKYLRAIIKQELNANFAGASQNWLNYYNLYLRNIFGRLEPNLNNILEEAKIRGRRESTPIPKAPTIDSWRVLKSYD